MLYAYEQWLYIGDETNPIAWELAKKIRIPMTTNQDFIFHVIRLQQKRCSNCCFVPGAAAAWSKWRSFWTHRVFMRCLGVFKQSIWIRSFACFFPIKDSEIYIDIWYTERLFYYFLAILETKTQLFDHFQFSWVLNLPYGLFFMAHPWLIQIPVGLHIGPKIDRWHSSTCQKGLGFSDVHKLEGHMRQVAAANF